MVFYKKTCSSKSFLNFRLSSSRMLIKWFLIKNVCNMTQYSTVNSVLIDVQPDS